MPEEPLFAGAFMCERVLRETDGANSAIRIVDRVRSVGIGLEPPEVMPPLALRLALVMGVYGHRAERTGARPRNTPCPRVSDVR